MFRLDLLGGFQLSHSGDRLNLASGKAQVLLARLALASAHGVGRESMCAFLWETSDEAQARASLRQALSQIRRSCASVSAPLLANGDCLALDRDRVSVDLDDLGRAARQGIEAAALIDLLKGAFLEGIAVREPSVEEWLCAARARVRMLELEALDLAAGVALQSRDLSGALALALRAVASDPLRETAHRLCMRVLHAQGEPAAAIRQFKLCRDTLDRELNVRPEPETIALYEEIRSARAVALPSQATDLPARPTAELREVALLCVLGPPASDPEEQAAPSSLRATVERAAIDHGGHSFATAEGFLVAFGVEVANADDVERAEATAAAVLENEPSARIGFAIGRVLVDLANPEALLGETRRRALAQAVAAAEGTIAADASAARPRRHSEPPFVGRTLELRQLRSVLAAGVEAGTSVGALISGEPGIGKTRLVSAFAEGIRATGGVAVTGTFRSFGRRAPLRDQLASALVKAGGRLAEPIDAARAALLARMTGAPLATDAATLLAAMPQERFDTLAVAIVAALVASLPRSPKVLVVDNAHWAETEDLAFLAALVERLEAADAMFIVTERSGAARFGPRLRRANLNLPVASINLPPLRPSDARALAGAIGLAESAFVDAAIARTGGNALFLLRLLEAGAAAVDDAPTSVVLLVQEQTDRLPKAQCALLRRASIFGETFDPTNYARAFGTADFSALVATGLLVLDLERIAFAHALVHEAVYGAMTRQERRALHAQAADAFKSFDSVRWADHSVAAGTPDAAEACNAAVKTLLLTHEIDAAARYVDAGLAVADEADARADLLINRGSMRLMQGDLDAALADYAAAADISVTGEVRARALIRQGWAYRFRGDLDAADAVARHVLALQERELCGDTRADLMNQLGAVAFARADHARSLAYHQRALDLAEGSLVRSRSFGGLGDALYAAGRMQAGSEAFAACVELARRDGHGIVVVSNACMEGACSRFANPGRATWHLAQQALERARGSGYLRAHLLSLTVVTDIALEADEACLAAPLLDEGRALVDELQSKQFRLELDWHVVRYLRSCSDRQAALAVVDGAIAGLDEDSTPYLGAVFFAERALLSNRSHEREHALAEGEKLLTAGSLSHAHLWYRQLAVDICLELEDWDGVEAHAGALAAFTAAEPLHWADNLIGRAHLLAAAGRGEAGDCERARALALEARLEAALQRSSLPALRAAYGR
ncbi:MAG: AAA family ATPase [Pseudomonadota bacterium]